MAVNTNDLRALADRVIAYLTDDQHAFLHSVASELDATRTERNLLTGRMARAELGAPPPPDWFVTELKIDPGAVSVTTDFLQGLERLAEDIDEGRPDRPADVWLRQLVGLLIVKERADIRRSLPYDPGG